MDIISRFKKDYVNYLISIILPAVITGGFIPLLKRTLGAELYGKYAIFFYAALLCTAILSGWLVQSILLFYNYYQDKSFFLKSVFRFFLLSQAVIFVPVIVIVSVLTNSISDGVFFFLIVMVCSLQSVGLCVIQASNKSAKNIYSEVIRSVLYLLIWLFFFFVAGINSLQSLYTCTIISYAVSFLYIYWQIKIPVFGPITLEPTEQKELFKKFINYGGPFSLFYIFSYLLSYIDKIFLLKTFGHEMQGNYQAIFDMSSKTIVLVLSPVLTTLFPLLTEAYVLGEKEQIRKILFRIVSVEIIGMSITLICYWVFGANILFYLLKIPVNAVYKQMGLIVIIGTFIWQIAMVAHKYFELKRMSIILLKIVVCAFLLQLFMYVFLANLKTPLLYPMGYLMASMAYLFFVVYFTKKKIDTAGKNIHI